MLHYARLDKMSRENFGTSLCQLHNEVLPISSLSPEVLSQIFILVRDMDETHYIQVGYRPQLRWLRVTRVCHGWRKIAFDCPALWSIFTFTNEKLAMDMLTRSRNLPLMVKAKIDFVDRRVEEQLRIGIVYMARELHRIKSIDLTFWSRVDAVQSSVLLRCFSGQARNLKSLRLCITVVKSGPYFPETVIPGNAFKDAPHLRNVELSHISLRWKSSFLSTASSISVLRLRYVNRPSLSEILYVLRGISQLATLEIIDCLPSHDSRYSLNQFSIVQLDHLENLILQDDIANQPTFIDHVRLSPRCRVQLGCFANNSQEEASRAVLSTIAKHLRQAPTIHPVQSAIITSSPLSTEIKLYDWPADLLANVPFSSSLDTDQLLKWSPSVQITFIGDNTSFSHLFWNIFETLDLSCLKSLALDCAESYLSSWMIHRCWGSLPSLESIKVRGHTRELCLAIKQSVTRRAVANPYKDDLECFFAGDAASGAGLPPLNAFPNHRSQLTLTPVTAFPALKTLIIEHEDLRRRCWSGGGRLIMVDLLSDSLKRRWKARAEIGIVMLSKYKGDIQPLKILGKYIKELNVNGVCVEQIETEAWSGYEGDEEMFGVVDESDGDFF